MYVPKCNSGATINMALYVVKRSFLSGWKDPNFHIILQILTFSYQECHLRCKDFSWTQFVLGNSTLVQFTDINLSKSSSIRTNGSQLLERGEVELKIISHTHARTHAHLCGVDGSLHNGEVISVQNVVEIRDLPSNERRHTYIIIIDLQIYTTLWYQHQIPQQVEILTLTEHHTAFYQISP